jgi:hypothetical protein
LSPASGVPVVVEPGHHAGWIGLALGALLLSLLAGAFWGGFVLGTQQLEAKWNQATKTLEHLRVERETTLDELVDLKQQAGACERMQQIEQEKDRSSQEQLKEAQDQRLALAKEVAKLKSLVRSGGRGGAAVQGLRLVAGEAPGEFRYSFTVSQLVEDIGEIAGKVALQVSGKQDGQDKTLTLDQLKGSDPEKLEMRFEHFQNFEGSLVLPAGFEPLSLTVAVKPEGDHLVESEETIPWRVEE